MTDKNKKWEVESPTGLVNRYWLGSFEDYSPNGYRLEDEFGWSCGDTKEMYADAMRTLKAQINVNKEQKKSDVGKENI